MFLLRPINWASILFLGLAFWLYYRSPSLKDSGTKSPKSVYDFTVKVHSLVSTEECFLIHFGYILIYFNILVLMENAEADAVRMFFYIDFLLLVNFLDEILARFKCQNRGYYLCFVFGRVTSKMGTSLSCKMPFSSPCLCLLIVSTRYLFK